MARKAKIVAKQYPSHKRKTVDRVHKDFGGIVDSLKDTIGGISKGFGDLVGANQPEVKTEVSQPEPPKVEAPVPNGDNVAKTAAAQIEPIKFASTDESTTEPVEVKSVENYASGFSLPKASARGGAIVPTRLPIGSDDPNDFFERLINYSFAVNRLYSQHGPEMAHSQRYPRTYGDGGVIKKSLDIVRDIIHSQKKAPDINNLARVADKFVYHSGVKPDLDKMRDYLEPQHG